MIPCLQQCSENDFIIVRIHTDTDIHKPNYYILWPTVVAPVGLVHKSKGIILLFIAGRHPGMVAQPKNAGTY